MDFLHNLLPLIEQYMLAYGYWAVFFGVMLENAGLPIPGETILLVAGYFASTGVFRVPLVMLVAATGAVIGDNIGFAIGHHYGRGFLLRVGRFFFLTPKRLEYMENYFESHGNKTILSRALSLACVSLPRFLPARHTRCLGGFFFSTTWLGQFCGRS